MSALFSPRHPVHRHVLDTLPAAVFQIEDPFAGAAGAAPLEGPTAALPSFAGAVLAAG